jgi:hypothetical protein
MPSKSPSESLIWRDTLSPEVRSGPFAGMRYPRFAVGRGELVVAQLLGAYELELHDTFEGVIARAPERVVDVGASDGYYAVGFARALPGAVVEAFEMNPFPARVCRALAEENGVADRVRLHGLATPESLAALAAPAGTFVLCDAEGAEAELMDPERVPWLRAADLVVELHDFAAPGIEELIRTRFAATHAVEVLHSRRRYVAEHPALMEVPGVSYMDREMGLSEFRPVPISWAVLTCRR